MPSEIPPPPPNTQMNEERDTEEGTPNGNDEDDFTSSTDVSIDTADETMTETECAAESMDVDAVETAIHEDWKGIENEVNVDRASDVGESDDTSPVETEEANDDEEKGGEAVNVEVDKNDGGAAASSMPMPAVDTEPEPMVTEKKVEAVAVRGVVDYGKQKKLEQEFDVALDRQQERISASILALRTDEHNQAKNALTDDNRKKSNAIYASLRDASKEAYHALVEYGSSFDLSSIESSTDKHESSMCLSETRRSRLASTGKNIWTTIRSNPELFEDVTSEDRTHSSDNEEGDYLAFEGKKYKASAGGYVRAVAARLVLLDYIDTRCSVGSPPSLHAASGEGGRKPSMKELVFGLKVFSRAGKAILAHSRSDPRASHDTLSLATSCFNTIKHVAETNSEASDKIKDLFDEAFDAFSLLPNAAAQFGLCGKMSSNLVVEDSAGLILGHLKQAEQLLSGFCNFDDSLLTASKVAILQRYLPSLARLCYKHGNQLVKMGDFAHSSEALHIALRTTNKSLEAVREALKKENDPLSEGANSKAKGMQLQVLHNLEADLVVVSIEAFYIMSHIFQSTGKQDKALQCLDMIERYMKEQQDRDDELYATAMSKVDKDFVFSEGDVTASAIEGPKKQDKIDIKTRASTVRANAKKRHAHEKATLAFCRIMIYQVLPNEEAQIDKLIRDLVELSWKYTKASSSTVSSAQHALRIAGYDRKSIDGDHIFALALNAIRAVHVRRISSCPARSPSSDPYKVLLEKIPKAHIRRPFILLDKLNALLTARYQIANDHMSSRLLDNESLNLAREYIETAKSFFDQSSAARSNSSFSDTTLFVASNQAMCSELFHETKAHFARAVSLYHSTNDHVICAQYAEMLEIILKLSDSTNYSDLENINAQVGEVMAVKAYALSMSGSSAEACKAAREAWDKVKTIDTMVNLFHCSLVHEMKYNTCDTLLVLDTSVNDLALCLPTDDIIAAFPRLSNSCVENEQCGGELILLGVQERWIKMLVCSKMLHKLLENKADGLDGIQNTIGTHSVFAVLRAYLQNFEHVIETKQDDPKVLNYCETLLQVNEVTLGFIIKTLRDVKPSKAAKGRRKRKEEEPEFVLIWDNDTVKKLVGSRQDCVWITEQLWNLSNKLMMASFGADGKDTRNISSQLFACSHDYCLLSEEEEGSALSKNYLDIDYVHQLDILSVPSFNLDQETSRCDISSEFSGQCLLISAATAVDFLTNATSSTADNRSLLHRTLHRLTRAQDEFLLNCEDEVQKKDVGKMIALLTLRCLLGIGNESLACDVLVDGGLGDFLQELCKNEHDSEVVLRNTILMASCAEEKQMGQTSRILLRSCALCMSHTGKFVLHLDQCFSLGGIQRKIIQSASTSKEVLLVYKDIDALVKKHKEEKVGASAGFSEEGVSFYSKDELDWFGIEAYNQGVGLTLLGDFPNASVLFATALNIAPLCSSEVQSHAKNMQAAYQNCLSKNLAMGETLSFVLGQVGF